MPRQRRKGRHPWSFAFSVKRIASMTEEEFRGPLLRFRERRARPVQRGYYGAR